MIPPQTFLNWHDDAACIYDERAVGGANTATTRESTRDCLLLYGIRITSGSSNSSSDNHDVSYLAWSLGVYTGVTAASTYPKCTSA